MAPGRTSFADFVHRLADNFPISHNEMKLGTDLVMLKGLSLTPSQQELEALMVHSEILLMELPENSISKIEKCLILASKVLGAI